MNSAVGNRSPETVALFERDTRAIMYYWWYEFLRLNEGYEKCCRAGGRGEFARIYRDFGDVHKFEFLKWWNTFGPNVAGPYLEPFIAVEITSKADLSQFGRLPDPSVLVVAIHAYAKKEEIEAEISKMLERKQPKTRGRPEWDTGLADYPVKPWPREAFLQNAYNVIVEKRRCESGTPLHEIGIRAGLLGSSGALNKGNDPAGSKRRELARRTARYIRQAEAIIRNAAKGRFPEYPRRGR